jgi:hypothetical protein
MIAVPSILSAEINAGRYELLNSKLKKKHVFPDEVEINCIIH